MNNPNDESSVTMQCSVSDRKIKSARNKYLITAAFCSGLAALLHFGCVVFGGDWYRFLGAGEAMAQMAEAGHIYPTLVTSAIALMLLIWAMYALSGAGLIINLPLLRLCLCVIAAIFLLRGLAFVFLMPMFPGNSLTFWLVSSAVCLFIGLMYLLGIRQAWPELSRKVTKRL